MKDMDMNESPLLGRGKGEASLDWGKFLKVLIAVLTALAGSLGLASCM